MDYELMMNGNVRIGQNAPDFDAITTYGNKKLSDYKGKWLVFFSHPGDFTSVSTTEMIAFAKGYHYFKKINTELLGISIDSNSSHLAWMYDIFCRTGIVLPFPIIADRSGEISRKYGMIASDISNIETVRNVYLIDEKGIIRVILVYPLNIGRGIPEILRTVEALQMADCANALIPANWIPGNSVIIKSPQTFTNLQERIAKNEWKNSFSWYLEFKESIKEC